MFTKPTVFILGAGASAHYGYPTGPKLIELMAQQSKYLLEELDSFQNKNQGRKINKEGTAQQWCPKYILDKVPAGSEILNYAINETINECRNLIDRLRQVDPLVIDYFLNYNQELRAIGKLLISLVLLQCSSKRVVEGNWCRYLLHHMMMGCEHPNDFIKENNVTFISFNYDLSLEENISSGLKHNDFFKNTNVVDEFINEKNFIHVYGKIKKINYTAQNVQFQGDAYNRLKKLKDVLDPALMASEGLLTIAPIEKIKDQSSLVSAKKAIDEAECVYILGYGFDKQNSANLGLDKFLHFRKIRKQFRENKKKKYVYFTNLGSKNIVSKKASQLFFSTQDKFLPPRTLMFEDANNGMHYEMSEKNVCDALNEDFEFLD